ncbi:hypothetical protein SAMN02745121_08719 [Nannocystis exedens]|uniref:Uncharacterized protein n=1 Tax=Nannocystis exedens TaxID=54 RepID=A0A1I2IH12_9BACT|nr:hypothetical protein [Nannocystis exedens]PCC73127.1 hypothetical protein NAEX_06215 [Nannocystis exedens]SFF41619.1 hypothetical protein SAMN02745121_08719 [Nannocystis exedens]
MSQSRKRQSNVVDTEVPGLALETSPEQPKWAIVLAKSGERVLPLLADDADAARWVVKQLGDITSWAGGPPDVKDARAKDGVARVYRGLTYPRVASGWTYDNSRTALFSGG